MSTTPLAVLGDDGVDVGRNTRNITYLYGLSDFFSFIFEDTETLNLLLEANAITASQIYSHFLQLTSTLSLETIQTFTGSTIKLLLLKPTDLVSGTIATYVINEPIEKIKLLTNRPFLPTQSLEDGVDFKVTRRDFDSSFIQFARPLSEYKFSFRVGSTGVTEYAIWLNDILLDEQLMSKHFGNLIAIKPETSSESFSNFIYGLYFVYMNGPTLGLLKRGLNLVLGAPLARANEIVLDIRSYLGSDQILIITDQNQYLLPFGLSPAVNIGDSVVLGQLLAVWIELKDYINDGAWWINVSLPQSIVEALPPRQISRFATAGSPYDKLMQDYLHKNTFLVRVNVGNFKNIQQFAQITDIISRSKPAHTQPVYVWAVPLNNEDDIHLVESENGNRISFFDVDALGNPIELFRRNNYINPLQRAGTFFLRCNVPPFVSELVGENPELGQNQRNYFNDVGATIQVSGFRSYKAAIINLSPYENAWLQATSATGNYMWNSQANQYSPVGVVTPTGTDGYPSYRGFSDYIAGGKRVVALYTTTLADIATKLTSLGISSSVWAGPGNFLVGTTNFLTTNYTLLFNKTVSIGNLGGEFPQYSYLTYKPLLASVGSSDQLFFTKISPTIVGVYWVTTNTTVIAPSLIPVDPPDKLELRYTVPLNRSSGIAGQPWYLTRGGALQNFGDTTGHYTDAYNLTPISVNRAMGAPSWPSSGSLTLVNHVTKAS